MIWHGCYDDSWRGLIVDSAFSHPAKASRGLVVRIFDYLFERGHLQRGSLVVDPFGGIGTTGIEAASRGCRFVGCELESKFHALAGSNFELHRRTWEACGDPLPVIVQGDSRKLSEVLGPVLASAVVSSPPYNLPMSQDHNGKRGGKRGTNPSETGAFVKYGNTPGQLEGLPMGDVDAVIGSPPYSNGTVHDGNSVKPELLTGNKAGKNSQALTMDAYGQTPGNIANMPAGNVADAIISSPPYEEGLGHKGIDKHPERACNNSKLRQMNQYGGCNLMNHDNLGNVTGDTFWASAKIIVHQCHAILKPGGVCVWITKDFVRNKKRVPFSDDWRKLCESCGFELVERIKASLVKERVHATLYGEHETKRTGRKSFFRRLAERRAAANNLWLGLSAAKRKRFTAEAISQATAQIDAMTPEDMAKRWGDTFSREKEIARMAKNDAPILSLYEWEASGGDANALNSDTRIDHEDVLVMRKL